MAMLGVDSGSLQADSQPKSSGLDLGRQLGDRLALFYIHQINRVNSCNGSATMTAPQTLSCTIIIYYY